MPQNQQPLLALEEFSLVPAALSDYPILQNMARFYVYDMSQYFSLDPNWAIPEDGLYECIDFKKYWLSDNTWPFFIRYQNTLAGFVIIDKKGSDINVDYNMAQFFILRRFKGHGVGRYIASHCFSQFKGVWEVMVMLENVGAYHFWHKVIHHYSEGQFECYQRVVAHLERSKKNIFRFSSQPAS